MTRAELRSALTYLPIGALVALAATGAIRFHPDHGHSVDGPIIGEPARATTPALSDEALRAKIARVVVDPFEIVGVILMPGGYTKVDVETAKGTGHLFLAPDHRYLIVGNLLDSQVSNLVGSKPVAPPAAATQRLNFDAEPQQPAAPKEAEFLDGLISKNAVIQGGGSNDLYVFFDPQCGVCHQFYMRLSDSFIDKYNLTVHWLPVVVLNRPESHRSAQFMADAVEQGDQEVARRVLDASMRGQKSPIPAEWVSNERALAYVLNNTETLLDAIRGIEGAGTPTVVFRDRSGETHLIGWMPDESELATVGPARS